MASDEVREYQVSVPAFTAATAPITQDISFPVRKVDEIRWHIPGGHRGQMGWRLTSAGAQVIPHNIGGWIIHDGASGAWAVKNLHDSGAWAVTAYNTDKFAHTIYVTMLVSIVHPRWRPVTLFSADELAPVPDLSHAGRPLDRRP